MRILPVYAVLLGVSLPWVLNAATLLQEGFESGQTPPEWSFTGTNQCRVTLETQYQPASGLYHMVLDDRVIDTSFSVAEATVRLNLAHKRDVVLSFMAKSLFNEPHEPPSGNFSSERAYDGVAISADNGATWRAIRSLATLGTAWETISVPLDAEVAALGLPFCEGFLIRFSAYDDTSAPLDGICIDNVVVTGEDDQRASLEIPSPLGEGTSGQTGVVVLAYAPAQPLTLTLSATPSGQVVLPATVVVPAGQGFATFPFSVKEDALLNGSRTIVVRATAPGVLSFPANLVLADNDVPVLNLQVPARLVEGESPSGNAMISIHQVSSVPVTVSLSANPQGQISLPATITLPAGQLQAAFTVRANNDTVIDGDVSVAITAGGGNMVAVTAQTLAADNESRRLGLTLPATVEEGSTASGMVTVPGSLSADLPVSLSLDNGSTVSAPVALVIPVGQSQVPFQIEAKDNALKDGSRTVGITVAAASFTNATGSLVVRDNDVDEYRFNPVGELLNLSSPISLTLNALDVEGNVISGYSGSVNLQVVLPDGAVLATTPATATLGGGSWTGTVTIPSISSAPLHVQATGDGGLTAVTTSFDVMRVLSLPARDLCWDESRSLLYASIPASAGGTNANQVVAIDPVGLRVERRLTGVENPARLALTSGGEFLYAAVNGGFTIARIEPSSMTVESTFAVGTDPRYGTLYVDDMCTVAGQPNLLVVSQYRTSVSPRHNGVAAYDNGVVLANITQDHTGSNVIEPSADPTLFFGYNTESTEYGFRHLRLTAEGMTQVQVAGGLFSGFSADFRTAGDIAVNGSGVVVDGPRMRRLGTLGLPTGTALVCADASLGRAYFLEHQTTFSTSAYNKLSAHDLQSLYLVKRITLPIDATAPGGFVRWGRHGLAFATGSSVVIITSSLLVPSDPPVDLVATMEANPQPAQINEPLTYTLHIMNSSTNEAANVVVGASLSGDQIIQSIAATHGQPFLSGANVRLEVDHLAAGGEVVLTVVTRPQTPGSLSCTANAISGARDPDFSNNLASASVSAGYDLRVDAVSTMRLNANNLIHDSSRSLLWATIPSTVDPPLGRSIVSIDPVTGRISNPIAIGEDPVTRSIALSANGRYLYVGLSGSPEVYRADLQASPVTGTRIPLGTSQWGSPNYAQDIVVLEGDGTSILVTSSSDHAAAVYDGEVRRTARTGIYSVDRIERAEGTGLVIGYNNWTSGFGMTDLAVTPTGVSVARTVSNLISGYGLDIKTSGTRLLSSSGLLVDASAMSLLGNLGVAGRPCLDEVNQRAYLVNGNALRAFDTATRQSVGNLPLPVASTGDWARECVRWGRDGIAILGGDDKLYIARWSKAITPTADRDGNHVLDVWESAYGGPYGIDLHSDEDEDGLVAALEYVFGSSPAARTASAVQFEVLPQAPGPGSGGAANFRLVYPRRQGLLPGLLRYQSSGDLGAWDYVEPIEENVLATETIDGVVVDWIEALLPVPDPSRGFARVVLDNL